MIFISHVEAISSLCAPAAASICMQDLDRCDRGLPLNPIRPIYVCIFLPAGPKGKFKMGQCQTRGVQCLTCWLLQICVETQCRNGVLCINIAVRFRILTIFPTRSWRRYSTDNLPTHAAHFATGNSLQRPPLESLSNRAWIPSI